RDKPRSPGTFRSTGHCPELVRLALGANHGGVQRDVSEDLFFAQIAPRRVGPSRPPLLNARTGEYSTRFFRQAAEKRASGPGATAWVSCDALLSAERRAGTGRTAAKPRPITTRPCRSHPGQGCLALSGAPR